MPAPCQPGDTLVSLPQHILSFLPVLAGSESPGFAGGGAAGKARTVKHIALNNVRKGKIMKKSKAVTRGKEVWHLSSSSGNSHFT